MNTRKSLLTLVLSLSAISSMAQFASEDELSMITTSGNSELKTYAAKSNNTYKFEKNALGLKGSYTYGESDSVRTTEKWDGQLRFDHQLLEKLNVFAAELVEANRFAGFSRRYNSDLGLKYLVLKDDKNSLSFEVSYRYSLEENTSNAIADKKDSKSRIYSEVEKILNENVTGKLWLEYLPNFTESEDYQINFEPSLSVSLSKIFSLKTSYLWKYDHEPVAGKKTHDTTYTTSIIAKF